MRVTSYRNGNIVIDATHAEYDVLLTAILLMELSAIGVEPSADKLRLIEQIKIDMQNIRE
jgi:hypothetical protein